MYLAVWLLWSLLCCVHYGSCSWSADTYWNMRYDGQLNYVSYTPDDTSNGLWSDNPSLKSNYLLASGEYNEGCSGCTCTADKINVTDCSGPTV
ncbi:hypothetical protein LSAT2_008302 [Lamellibrachia satsuma]|nr:hypothetical protein LSAT2_008302 [Lamellibrachia satsuma]